MSEYDSCIVPLDDTKCRGKKRAVVSHFQKIGLIDGYYDEEYGWYAGGNCEKYPDLSFEYIAAYDKAAVCFLPMCHTGRYLAVCPKCNGSLDQVIYELRDDWPDYHEMKDMSKVVIPCPACGERPLLGKVRFGIETAMTRFFIRFSSCDVSECPELLQDVERLLGCKTRIVEERF